MDFFFMFYIYKKVESNKAFHNATKILELALQKNKILK